MGEPGGTRNHAELDSARSLELAFLLGRRDALFD